MYTSNLSIVLFLLNKLEVPKNIWKQVEMVRKIIVAFVGLL